MVVIMVNCCLVVVVNKMVVVVVQGVLSLAFFLSAVLEVGGEIIYRGW